MIAITAIIIKAKKQNIEGWMSIKSNRGYIR